MISVYNNSGKDVCKPEGKNMHFAVPSNMHFAVPATPATTIAAYDKLDEMFSLFYIIPTFFPFFAISTFLMSSYYLYVQYDHI